MRNVNEVDDVAAAIRKLLASRGSQLVQEDVLRRLLRDLEAQQKGGRRPSGKRIVKLVAEISQVVCAEFMKK
jgi:hypothetical protein